MFFGPCIALIRVFAEARVGVVNGTDKEWLFNGWKVCDGLDPEGNVVQFRERAG